jgi:hypothetical protein
MRLTEATRARRTPRPRLGVEPVIDPNHAAIFERLEITKKYGLVSDYLVSWSGLAGHHSAKVTVWGRSDTPADVVKHYVSRLLRGLVTDRQISVAAD